MRRLILFRHAKAGGRRAGMSDMERALEPGGREDARLSGRWMAASGWTFDLALVSTSVRTRETWDCVADFFPAARVEYRDEIYDAAPQDIEETLDEVSAGADGVLVVGHNPGLHELAVALVEEGPGSGADLDKVEGGFPTATVAVFGMDANGRATLEALFNPRRDTPPPFVEAWDDEAGGAS